MGYSPWDSKKSQKHLSNKNNIYKCVCVCVCVYVCVYHFAVHLKLTQYWKLTIFQLKSPIEILLSLYDLFHKFLKNIILHGGVI